MRYIELSNYISLAHASKYILKNTSFICINSKSNNKGKRVNVIWRFCWWKSLTEPGFEPFTFQPSCSSAKLQLSKVQPFFDPTELIINGHRVPHDGLRPIFSKAIKKGVFNLLYTFLTLRPCFGCFNPELVETFENEKFAELTVDSNFVGSSQSGRTYAGCVRSKRCNVLADSRVSDTCLNCSNLRNIAINRSVLTSPGKSP